MEDFIEKNLIPLFSECINSSETELALDSLKAAKALVYYSSLADLTQVLNSALQHKSKDVAHLSLDVLRMMHETEGKVKPLSPGEYKKILIDAVIPFLVTCFRSGSDDTILSALSATKVLSEDAEIKEILFNPVEKMILHKNQQISYLALDIIRDVYIGKEIHLFEGTWDKVANFASGVLRKIKKSTEETRIEIARPVSAQTGGESVERIAQKVYPQIKEIPLGAPMQRREEIQGRIIDVLKTNPEYVEGLKEIKSRYKIN
ncbi:Uncharacterised protein [uncultured archaeon]|nr:Uncharacterised protein [uncultured archaeon]